MLDAGKRIHGRRLPYLRNANVRWDDFDLEDLSEMPFEEDELERYTVRQGDLMVCEGGEPGRAAIWPGDTRPIKYQKAILRVRPRGAVEARWLLYSLRLDASKGSLEHYFTGSTIKHFPQQSLLRYTLRLPPLAEQRRIVEKVEALLAQVNAARARLAKVPPVLNRLRQSILASACSGRLTADWRERNDNVLPASLAVSRQLSKVRPKDVARYDVDDVPDDLPTTWTWTPLGLLGADPSAPVQTGPFGSLLLRHEFIETGVPVVAVGNLTGLGFKIEGLYHVTREKAEQLARFDVEAGDLLFARSGATLGKVCVAPDFVRGWRMTGHILRIRLATDILLPALAAYALRAAPSVVEQVVGNIRGATRPGYNTALLESIRVPVPPSEEQQEIVRRVGALFALVDAIETRVAAAIARADKVTQAILWKALSGELVPTEAELARAEGRDYESAPHLLERIRAQAPTTAASPARRARRSGGRGGAAGRAAPRSAGVPTSPSSLLDLGRDEVPERVVIVVVNRRQHVRIEKTGRCHSIEHIESLLPDDEPITHEVPLGLQLLDHLRRLLEFDHHVPGMDTFLEEGECCGGNLTLAGGRSRAVLRRALAGERVDLGLVEDMYAIGPALGVKNYPFPAANCSHAHAKRGCGG